jgi:hypothetical protein
VDKEEIAQEMLRFLQDTKQYQDFLTYMDNKGFDRAELEENIENEFD